ncbi:uncharacterized protein LOC133283942 isoform X2 [Gastrolobium bilobum]|uniref:uncharacterized protein LOC133283942 isoform X2 n=1 Tax=Gastrolobium bilobum TaxID=150636 RepID=UPI002AAF85EE|nr:uncharacterized protein LOC133283942 isoform X2 [Gastrolobium bilobum]
MRGYDRDELQDYDDYEDEGLEGGEEYEEDEGEEDEEEEPRKPTKEELDYLELRQKLKDSIRKQMKKENSTSLADSSARKKKLPYDNYGSFFGPSQPVIAQRVIQESKSLLENQHLTPRLSNSPHISKNTNKVSNVVSKSSAHNQRPKVSEKKVKAEKLKVIRDYSFLLSDDAELPAPAKEPPSRNASVRNSEGRPAQVAGYSKQPLINGGKHVHGSGADRKFVAGASHLPPKSGLNNKLSSTSKSSKASADSRKQLGSNIGNGPSRPMGPKGLPSKMPVSSMGNGPGRPGGPKGLSSKMPVSTLGNGPGRPVERKGLPSKMPVSTMENKSFTSGRKNPINGMQKPLPSKVHSSVTKQSLEQRKDSREQNKPKMVEKQPVASSKAQINKPLKQIPKHSDLQDHRPKNKVRKRYPDEDEDEGEGGVDYSTMIRSFFQYNPNNYVDDEDDDNMEAGFDEILREERRSAKIARKEDEEQLRLIEEEEERERRKRLAKSKKRAQA